MSNVLKVAIAVALALFLLQIFRDGTSFGGSLFVTAPTAKVN